MLSPASLADVLASASLSEYTSSLAARIDDLNALAPVVDKKALLELLKSAGCAKMGVRQTVRMQERAGAGAQSMLPMPLARRQVPGARLQGSDR